MKFRGIIPPLVILFDETGELDIDLNRRYVNELLRHIIHGVLAVNPFYWKLSDEQLYNYYSIIAESTKLPVILYNIPSLTGQSLSVELVKRLACNYLNIRGIREAARKISQIREMITAVKTVREDFMIFSAFDEHLLPA
ncbi:dihydrodipicolinate synthase family protein [Sporosarcina sp. BP05]|uniref:dihydrodipicolinate synthase family protein n=1 Tax=Sporosarcina sp. BP05 TaxID=2758726 RepID=UPI0016454614|nr:dihydrodipicolinate synthase family protein [Sporosarcina sp. BP05]